MLIVIYQEGPHDQVIKSLEAISTRTKSLSTFFDKLGFCQLTILEVFRVNIFTRFHCIGMNEFLIL